MSRPIYGTCVAVPSGRVSHICPRCSCGLTHDTAADLLCRHRCARAGGGATRRDGRAAVAARVGCAGSGLLPQNEPADAAFTRKLLVPAPQGRLPLRTTCSGCASSLDPSTTLIMLSIVTFHECDGKYGWCQVVPVSRGVR